MAGGAVRRDARRLVVMIVLCAFGVCGGPAGATGDPWFERRETPIAVSPDEYLVLVHERRSPGYPPTVIETLSWQRFDLVTNRLTALVELRRDERTWAGVGRAPETERLHEADAKSASLTAALDGFGGVPIGPSTRLVKRFRATADGLFVVEDAADVRVLAPSVLGLRLEASDALFEYGKVTVLAMYRTRYGYLVVLRGTGPIGTQEIVLSLPPR